MSISVLTGLFSGLIERRPVVWSKEYEVAAKLEELTKSLAWVDELAFAAENDVLI